jgi:hypothetical protein
VNETLDLGIRTLSARCAIERPRYLVQDRDNQELHVAFHLDLSESIAFNPKEYKIGHTLAVLNAEQHNFFDGTIGLRLESLSDVTVRFFIPQYHLSGNYRTI